MTRRTVGAQLVLLSRGDRITANWLNDVAAATARNARKIEDITTEVPEGEDGDGAAVGQIFTETARTTSTVRIEDASDPSVYVDIERIETIDFQDGSGNTLRLVFSNT